MNRNWGPDAWSRHWHLQQGETLAGVLAEYEEVARHTDDLVATLPDLDADHALPEAPWFEPGARWSARRVFLHIIAETVPARRARRHPAGVDRRPEDDGVSGPVTRPGRRRPPARVRRGCAR